MSGILFDECGKHQSHQKVSDDIYNLFRDHISSLPARTSHYSRKHNSARKAIARLYKDFLKIHDPDYLKLELGKLPTKSFSSTSSKNSEANHFRAFLS